MITAEKTISINVKIFTKSRKQLDDISSTLKQDFIRAVQNRKEKIEKDGNSEIQIHLMQDSKCPNCGKAFTDCKCGRPSPRPLT